MSVIISTTDLDSYTGETLDAARSGLVVAAVNDYIETVTGRSWGEVQSGTETHDYAPTIFLRHQDVVEITEVQYGVHNGDLSTLTTDEYAYNGYGRLRVMKGRVGFHTSNDYVNVTYTHGSVGVPNDLKLAALALASDFYNYAANGQTEVSSESIGTYQLQYKTGSSSSAGKTHFDVINHYRTRRV